MFDDAVRAADFVFDSMRDDSGRLLRVLRKGMAPIRGFLDDHAALLTACLDLHRAGAADRFLERAAWLADEILDRFSDANAASIEGELFLTAEDAPDLIHRPRSDPDGATPEAAGLALLGLTRLGALSHSGRIEPFLAAALRNQSADLERAPHAFPTLLRAVALRSRGLSVAVIVGDSEAAGTRALAARARRVLRPEDAILVRPEAPGQPDTNTVVSPDWWQGREAIDGKPTAYICRGRACSLPIQDPARLIADLEMTA